MSSIESKRVQYRKYLERAGVIDALSKALIKLYEEQNKPDDAIRFVRKFMCESCPDDTQFDLMKSDLDEARNYISKLEQELERLRSQIKKSPEEIAEELEAGFKTLTEDEDQTGSLLRKYLLREVLDEYMGKFTKPPTEASLLDCVQAGLEHHDAKIGAYAADPNSYETFEKLFDPIVKDYHQLLESEAEQLQPERDWGNADEIENLDPERKYIISTRIRLARNLEEYPFFAKLKEKHYLEIEEKVRVASEVFEGEHIGQYYAMNAFDSETQQELIKRHVLFGRANEELATAGCYRFWPMGRGVYYNPAETFIIWINRKDHLNVISMAKCGDLGDTYNRLMVGIQELEKNLNFVRNERYGYLSSDPRNLGTGLHASAHMRLPLLSQREDQLIKLGEELELRIYSTEGENAEIVDGVVEVSYARSLGLSEFEIVKKFQDALISLIKSEQQLEAGGEEQE